MQVASLASEKGGSQPDRSLSNPGSPARAVCSLSRSLALSLSLACSHSLTLTRSLAHSLSLARARSRAHSLSLSLALTLSRSLSRLLSLSRSLAHTLSLARFFSLSRISLVVALSFSAANRSQPKRRSQHAPPSRTTPLFPPGIAGWPSPQRLLAEGASPMRRAPGGHNLLYVSRWLALPLSAGGRDAGDDEGATACERRGENLKDFKGFQLKAKAIIRPCMCPVRSTAARPTPTSRRLSNSSR